MRFPLVKWLFLTMVLAMNNLSAQAADAPDWNTLSAEQQQLLGAFQQRWNNLPAEQRQQILDRAKKFHDMSPEQQQQIRERFQRCQFCFRRQPGPRRVFAGAACAIARSFRRVPAIAARTTG